MAYISRPHCRKGIDIRKLQGAKVGTDISKLRTEISRVVSMVQGSGLNVQRYQYWFNFALGICLWACTIALVAVRALHLVEIFITFESKK